MVLSFQNPVIAGFNPDPSIARNGDDFFLATSSFEYFPGVPIYHSRDLFNWTLIGHALTRRSQLEMRTVEPGAGIWAPTLRWRKGVSGKNGRFYLVTCMWNRYQPQNDERIFPRGFYVYTDNIWDDHAWSEPIYLDNPGFDQDLFWDDDGTVYLSTTTRKADRPPNSNKKDFAIHISKIDLDSGKSLTAPSVIRTSESGIAEGSHIIKRGKYYYLFTAEGGTESGHQEWVSRSEEGPLGPWTLGPRNPLLHNGTSGEVQNTGHVDVFQDSDGMWWAVLLGVRPRRLNGKWEESPLGRETFLVRVHWVNDWPIFNYDQNISLETNYHMPESNSQDSLQGVNKSYQDIQSRREGILLGWYQKNAPLRPTDFQSKNLRDFVTLWGNCYTLSSPEAPAMVLRKQITLSQILTARMSFLPSKPGYEAGVVVWWSMYSYASAGVTRSVIDGSLETVFRSPSNEKHSPLKEGSKDFLEVGIMSSEERYTLSIADPAEARYHLREEVPVSTLIKSPPIRGAFTGMMFGLYAFGNGEPCLDPAVFSCISSL